MRMPIIAFRGLEMAKKGVSIALFIALNIQINPTEHYCLPKFPSKYGTETYQTHLELKNWMRRWFSTIKIGLISINISPF